MEEVGQQSDSVSDGSCHHAALTGCTPHFGNSKYKHAHSLILQAAGDFATVKTNYRTEGCVARERLEKMNVSG